MLQPSSACLLQGCFPQPGLEQLLQKSRHGRLASGQSPSASGLRERGGKRDQSWRSLSSAFPKAEEEGGSITDAWQEVGETPAGGIGGCLSWRLLARPGQGRPTQPWVCCLAEQRG